MNTCAKYRLFSHEYFPSRFTGIITVHNYGKYINCYLFIRILREKEIFHEIFLETP